MTKLTSENLSKWRAKRRICIRSFLIFTFCFGVEQSMILSSLWIYIKSLDVQYPAIWYSIILASFNFSSMIVSLGK